MSLKLAVQGHTVKMLLGLPSFTQRALARVSSEVDGRRLSSKACVLLTINNLKGEPDYGLLTPAESRRQSKELNEMLGLRGPEVRQIWDRMIPSARGEIASRLYVPRGAAEKGPLLIYFHGGGFVDGDLDSHDAQCRFMADRSKSRVLAVDYSLAPEHRFPAAVEDAMAALEWAHAEAAKMGVETAHIGVGGDSSGANLAAVVSQLARLGEVPLPAFQLLIYPVLDLTEKRRSFELFGLEHGLTEAKYDWFMQQYLESDDEKSDVRVSPLLAEDLRGLPPACILTAGFDILVDEADLYARRLETSGVSVSYHCAENLFHGFTRFFELLPEARQALGWAGDWVGKVCR